VIMFKAIHSFKAKAQSNTLSFHKGEVFCIVEETNDSWWLASSQDGKIGYVPKSYLVTDFPNNTSDIVLKSIDHAINAVYSGGSANITPEQQLLLKKLTLHRQKVISENFDQQKKATVKRQAPPPPTTQEKRQISAPPPPPQRTVSEKSGHFTPKAFVANPGYQSTSEEKLELKDETATDSASSVTTGLESIHVPNELGEALMTVVQTHSNLTVSEGGTLLKALFIGIGNEIHPLHKIMQEIIDVLPQPDSSENTIMDTLGLAFANLKEIKDDAQQRNWAIEDDQSKISNILEEILTTLSSEDKKECLKVLSNDDFTAVVTLANYYQMESRVSIRLMALQVLAVVCSVSNKCISVLLSSVLPDELAREIRDDIHDVDRVCYSALLLSMVFSTGEPVPVSYYDSIGYDFLTFLLKCIEDGVTEDVEDKIGDIFVRLILAINLHFVVPTENLVLKAIADHLPCTTLSEKVMLLVNRGDDPVLLHEDQFESDSELAPPSSVLKFLQDIFSLPSSAASFLYTNDLLVLVDIILRNITDLYSGSKLRTEYLDLLLNVVTKSTYVDGMHRSSEIIALLHRINNEEKVNDVAIDSVVDFDKTIVSDLLSALDALSIKS